MNPKPEAEVSRFDTLRWSAALAIVVVAIGLYHYFAQQLLVVRVGGVLLAFAVALVLVWGTRLGQEAIGYLGDSRVELRKVVWPTRQETLQTTLAVALMVLVMGIFLWLLDMLLLWGVRLLTGQGG